MYEPTYKLDRKAKYGSLSANNELQNRKDKEILIDLKGINNENIIFIPTENIKSMTTYILHNLSKIDSNNSIEKTNIILDSYSTATIEGARTTVDKIKEIITKNDLNKLTKSEQMVLNSIKACNFAYSNTINMQNIRNLFEILTYKVCENEDVKGRFFRDGQVFVGNSTRIIHIPCKVENIEEKIREMFTWLNNSDLNVILKSCIAHFYIVYIHPFCDGNGRLARLFNSSYMINNGYNKIRYVSLSESINNNLHDYYLKLEESEYNYNNTLDITPFIEYMMEMICESIENTISKYIKLSDIELKLLSKINKNNEITVRTAAKLCNKSEADTRNILNKLTNLGYFNKNRVGNKNIYTRVK